MEYNEEVEKALETLRKNGYNFDIDYHRISTAKGAMKPDREAIKILEKNGYWIDFKSGTIKDVAGIIKTEKVKCLENDSVENKLAVLKHIKEKYGTPQMAAKYGYPLDAIKHAFDVLEREKQNPKDTSKTYVCSDIHGMYGSYCNMIKKIKETDTLFILGDVIDRGKGGIKILQDMMKRPNVKLLMGNHEYMMINCLDLVKKYNLNLPDIQRHIENTKLKKSIAYDKLDMSQARSDEERREYQNRIDANTKLLSQRSSCGIVDKMSPKDLEKLDEWIIANKGEETIKAYMRLGEEEREKIYNYLNDSIVMANIIRNNQNYLLVHSRPVFTPWMTKNKNREGAIRYSRIKDEKAAMNYIVWTRDDEDNKDPYKMYKDNGFTTICGHTPTKGKVEDMRKERGVLRIDSGCGHRDGKLSLYCIEDDSIEFMSAVEFDDVGDNR